MDVGFDGAQGPTIEHFTGGGRDATRGDVDDGFGGIVESFKNGEKSFYSFGKARKFNGDLGDKRESAFGADKKSHEIVSGGIERGTADANEFARGENGFERQGVIGGDPVGERVRAAGIFGNVAANGASFLAGRVGCEMQAGMRDCGAEIGIDDAGLDRGTLIFDIYIENAIHMGKNGEDAAIAGERAAGKSGAGSAADDGRLVLIGKLHNALDMSGGAGEYDAGGTRDFNRAIVFVEQQFLGAVEDRGIAEKGFEIAEEFGFHAFGALGKNWLAR